MSNSKCAPGSEIPEKHIDYSLQFNQWILKPIGAWPQINASSSVYKIIILLQIFICLSIIAIPTIPCLLYVLFEAENIQQKLNPMMPLINRFMSSMHYWVLLKRRNDIQKLIRHMETDWNLMQRIDEREVMLQHAKYGRFITIICGIMLQGGCLLFSFVQSIRTVTITIGNETFTTHTISCPIYSKIIDTRFTPMNEIALILQNMIVILVSFCTAGGCSLAAVFAIHACGQLNVLYVWLHELVQNQAKENDKTERKLAAIVEHHLRILSFISQVESITHKAAFVQLTGCTVIMSLLGYYTVTGWETLDTGKITSSLTVYLSMSFNIFIFCYIGEIVTEQCKYVGETAYMTNWYNLHHKTARDLVLIIARSNNVIKITAGKLIHLSVPTLVINRIIKTLDEQLHRLNICFSQGTFMILGRSSNSDEDWRRRFFIFRYDVLSIRVSIPCAFVQRSCQLPNVHQNTIDRKKYNDYSLQFSRWFLKPIGAWPQINASSLVCKIMILLHIFICSSMIASNMVPCLLYVLFEKVNIKLKLSAVGPLLHRVMGSVHYWVLLKRSGDIHKVIRHMETDWRLIQRLDNREVMLQQAKFGRFVAIICGIIMYGGTILFSIAKAMKTITINVGNETFTTHPMTCPIYSKIIDTRFSPVNEIALVLQNLAILVVSSSTVGACSLAAVFAIHACGQLKVLNAWLHELVQNQKEGNDTAERKLAAIVEHHLRILSLISQVESIMHKAALVELAGCTVVMCLLGYYTITAWETLDTTKITSSLIVYLSMGFNIFIFCYIGGIITEQCKDVGEMAYMTNWYNLHHKTARGLILIIARSNNVIKITAGKLFHLSIATFGDVIKTSMVYLNFLRTMTI